MATAAASGASPCGPPTFSRRAIPERRLSSWVRRRNAASASEEVSVEKERYRDLEREMAAAMSVHRGPLIRRRPSTRSGDPRPTCPCTGAVGSDSEREGHSTLATS
jgi:hypothetical protein